MRLLLINANTTPAITERCAAAARVVASVGTEIVPVTARTGPRIIGSRTENALAGAGVVELLAEHGSGCDAALIAISFDSALDAAREAAPFPVVGMTEAALHAAALLGGPIGFIGPVPRVLNVYRDVIARTGLAGRVAGMRALPMTAQAFEDPRTLLDPVAVLARDLIDRDHAESIVIGGAALAGLTDSVQAQVAVPVIDGIAAGVVLAEALVRLGRPKAAAGSHAKLPQRTIDGGSAAVTRIFNSD